MAGVAAAALMGACGLGVTGKATVVEVSSHTIHGLTSTTTAVVDVEGPVTNGALRCEFSGQHASLVAAYDGWTVHIKLPDLAAGASTRVECSVGSVFGGNQPSSPVVQLVSASSLPPPRQGSDVRYEPEGAWPSYTESP